MTINKQLAIEAIATEPVFTNGIWFDTQHIYDHASKDERTKCAECSVGSVLRKNCFTTTNYTEDIIQQWCKGVTSRGQYYTHFDPENKNYLGNLSMLFEHLYKTIPIDDLRVELINHIEAFWPDDFELN